MLAPEDVVDLGEALRKAGFKVSTPQLFAVQQLLLRLAAEGALPATREPLARWIAPVLCTSAAEQAAFGARWRGWLHERFGEALPAPPPPPGPPVPKPMWPRVLAGLVLVVALAVLWQLVRRPAVPAAPRTAGPPGAAASAPASVPAMPRPTPPASAPTGVRPSTAVPAAAAPASATAGLALVATLDLGADLPAPTLADRFFAPNAKVAAVPLLAWLAWLAWNAVGRRRRPTLSRIASRTPPQLREVHVPGAVRTLLPSLPLRRLAQELRRRRTVESSELRVEPTVAATLKRGGLFTPVRGSRVEPDYLALVDRAGLSDHQARLAGEVVAELARSDVLVDRFDFDRDARLVRPRAALGREATAPVPHAVELAELHERLPEHRVLVFGDGSGCFDGYTGEPLPWTRTLAAWPMPVLLTPLPRERWGRREWALQRLGIQVLPLDAQGLAVLMGVVAGLGAPAPAAEAPRAPAPGRHEHDARRWLERDAPDADEADALVADLHAELGPRGMAWLAACAAYPEVHWGITLRLGSALVTAPGEFERLLPRIARLVWFREAFLPDWLRERLLHELAEADEALARATLRAMLESVARQGGEVPLRIALGTPDRGLPPWRRWFGDPLKSLLRSAPPDSPLRDHVFLRFLSGTQQRRIDLRAPGTLLAALGGGRAWTRQAVAAGLALSAVAMVSWFYPWLALGRPGYFSGAVAFTSGPDGLAIPVQRAFDFLARPWDGLGSGDYDSQRFDRFVVELAASGSGWSARAERLPETDDGPIVVAGKRVGFTTGGRVFIRTGAETVALAGAGRGTLVLGARGGRIVLSGDRGLQVWNSTTDPQPRDPTSVPDATWSSIDLSPDERYLAGTGGRGVLAVYDLDTRSSAMLGAEAADFTRVRFSPDSRRIAALSETGLRIYDTQARLIRTLASPKPVDALAWSSDGRFIVTGNTDDGTARVWSVDTGTHVALQGTYRERLELDISPDGHWVAGLGRDGLVRLWDAATGAVVGPPLTGLGDYLFTRSMAFSPDSRSIAAVNGGDARIWRLPEPPAPTAPRALALLIGNGYGGKGAPASSALRDVRAIGAVLKERFGFDAQVLEEPDGAAMLAALDRLAAQAGPADRVVVMLSGRAAVDGGARYAYYATPAGSDPAPADAVSGEAIAQRLAAIRAGQLLVLGDTSGLEAFSRQSLAAAPAGSAGTSGARVLLAAASGDGNPYESAEGSFFTRSLEAVLRAAGSGLTDRSLFAELARRVPAIDRKVDQRPARLALAGASADGGTFTFPAPLQAASPGPGASAPSRDTVTLTLRIRSGQVLVAGAQVVVETLAGPSSQQAPRRATATTGSDGLAAVSIVRGDIYRVRVSAPGCETLDVSVKAGQSGPIDLRLAGCAAGKKAA